MKSIYFNTSKGIIKKEIPSNASFSDLCTEIEKAKKIDETTEQIKTVEIIISGNNPLSSQCKLLTGDSYNSIDFEDVDSIRLIKHKKTGLYIQSYNKEELLKMIRTNETN